MTKENTIHFLVLAYGNQLPTKNWFIHEDGEVYQSEGISFDSVPDLWWFLNEKGVAINNNWTLDEENHPAIHQDLLFETEEEAKEAARKYLEKEIAKLQERFLKLKTKE